MTVLPLTNLPRADESSGMNTDTSVFLDLLAVAFVFLLLALPSLIGHLSDRRVDRQLARAERGLPALPDPVAPVRTDNGCREAVRRAGALRAQ